jgi:hypothetical protein
MTVVAGTEVAAKLVLAGAAGAGRSELLRALAGRLGEVPVREGVVGPARVQRIEAIWPEPMADGRLLRLRVYAPTGHSCYNAVEELLVRGVDGVVLLFDVTPEQLRFGWEAMVRLADNLRRAGLEFGHVPMAVQYHRADRHAGFSAARLDRWLSLPAGGIPRLVTRSDAPDGEGGAVDAVVAEIGRRLVGPAENLEP